MRRLKVTGNREMWEVIREMGMEVLRNPKYNKDREALVRLKGKVIKPEVKMEIRRDLLRKEKEEDLTFAYDYYGRHKKDFGHFTIEDLDYLERWSMAYVIACDGVWEEGGKPSLPGGIMDVDYALYYIIRGPLPSGFAEKYEGVSYANVLVAAMRETKMATRERKQEVVRAYLRKHPDGDGYLLKGQIPPSFSEISGEVDPHEVMTFWRNHRYNPRMGRKGIAHVMRQFKAENGRLPKDGEECLLIIRREDWTSNLEDRIIVGVDRKLDRRAHELAMRELEEKYGDELRSRTTGSPTL